MVARFDKDVAQGTAPEFVAAKLAEREERHRRAGQSRYLVEPNVKDGKGGLRDLHTLFWIAKYVYRVREPEELIEKGVFNRAEYMLFRRCEDFLWSVRCHMHFVTGRAEERLSFDIQREIAVRLGYTSHPGLRDVERFMKHYFLIAKDVGDLTAILCAELEDSQAKAMPVLSRMMARFRPSQRRSLSETEDFIVDYNRILVADQTVFKRDPVNLIRIFHLAQKYNLAFHPDAMRAIRHSLHLIDNDLRENEEANRLFLEILTSKNDAETVLRRMNEAGVLGKFVRTFGRIVAMMQFNMYHHYTVDEHLLRCIGILSDIEAGRAEDAPFASELMRTIQPEHRTLLYVALFLHDIAKGRIEDHSIAGARVARRLCPRFGLSPAETDTVAWLVEQHLTMSAVAQSRDLSDRVTIQNFAEVVQSVERLKLLTLLTTADIKGVGPGVWNGWKAQLIRTLYYETEPVLTGGFSEVNRAQRVAVAQAELRAQLADWPPEQVEAYVARHYPAYWLKVDLPTKVAHARFVRDTEAAGKSLATAINLDQTRGVAELTVYAPDHPRLLSIIAGACAMTGANIVDAQIYTTTDARALDTIAVSRGFERDDDEQRRAARVASTIEQALARRSAVAGHGGQARAAQGTAEGVRHRARCDDQQPVVQSLHDGRGHRARPSRSALRTDRDAIEAQSQHRLGACRDLRRARGGRVLCDRSARRQDFVGDAAGGDQARAAPAVRVGRQRAGRSRGGRGIAARSRSEKQHLKNNNGCGRYRLQPLCLNFRVFELQSIQLESLDWLCSSPEDNRRVIAGAANSERVRLTSSWWRRRPFRRPCRRHHPFRRPCRPYRRPCLPYRRPFHPYRRPCRPFRPSWLSFRPCRPCHPSCPSWRQRSCLEGCRRARRTCCDCPALLARRIFAFAFSAANDSVGAVVSIGADMMAVPPQAEVRAFA